jgi:hypothetical protein
MGARHLFEQMADRMGKDRTNYPYDDFKITMMGNSSTDKRTLQEKMEDWLEGPYTIDMDRKKLLRRLFQEKGLLWSQDVFPLYASWANNQTGNRFQKMLHFINEHRALF